ncbi:MAG: FAD:protein FMN transferase [Spirochaetia bacterium]|nr:FAD:protein FMN transferase [Spirochaetia bacterium]
MKKKAFLILPFLLSACTPRITERSEWLMGTLCTIRFYSRCEATLPDHCFDTVGKIEKHIGATDPQSEVSAVNAGRQQTVSPILGNLIAVSLKTAAETDGAFSPVLGRLTALWGFSGEAPRLPADEEIARLLPAARLSAVAFDPERHTVTLKSRQSAFDFGAVGKGFASDAVKKICIDAGATVLINFGGNIQTVGSKPDGKPWLISIQSPLVTGTPTAGTLTLSGDWSLSTSGDYQKFFYENGIKYHHILDPATGKPADSGLRSVTVVSQRSGAETDALSTALFVMGEKKGIEWLRCNPDVGAVWMTRDNRLIVSANLADAFTPTADSPFTVSTLPLPR